MTRREFGVLSTADGFQCTINRHGVLLSIFNALHAADSIGMTLADALAPEGVILAVGENRICIGAGETEQTGIPTDGNNRHMTASLSRRVDVCKVLGNFSVGVKAVHNVEELSVFGRLRGKVSSRAAAENHNINLADPVFSVRHVEHRHASRLNLDFSGVATSKDRHEFSIRIIFNGAFNAASEVAVSNYSYLHDLLPPVNYFQQRNAL